MSTPSIKPTSAKRTKPVKAAKTPPKRNRRAERAAMSAEGRDAKGRFVDGNSGGPGPRTVYTEEIGDIIAARLAAGETLISICRDEGMPGEATVRSWALDLTHPFTAKYEHSRKLGYMRMADELADIADDGRNDWMEHNNAEGESLGYKVNGEHIQRSRLRTDVRKWILAKALPKIYGDKIALTDPDGGPLTINIVKGLAG